MWLVEATIIVGMVTFNFTVVRPVVHRGLFSLAAYLMYRRTRPRLTAPLAAFLNKRDRLLAIPVHVAEEHLAILRMFPAYPDVIAAAEKALADVRRAHEMEK